MIVHQHTSFNLMDNFAICARRASSSSSLNYRHYTVYQRYGVRIVRRRLILEQYSFVDFLLFEGELRFKYQYDVVSNSNESSN